MKTKDFTGMKLSEITKVFTDEIGFTISLAKRMAHEVRKLPESSRKLSGTALIDLLKTQEQSKKLLHKQSGRQKNTFAFSQVQFDEARLNYLIFLNRKDHSNTKEFHKMTEQEWVKYLIESFSYPKANAKKVARSMCEYLHENIEDIKAGKIKKYPLHPLYESK